MAFVWNPFGVANVAASVLLVVLGLLFLKARRSEFTVAFAAYSILAASQKFTGGIAFYFSADEATRAWWLLVSTLFLLASTPTLAHALAAFLGGSGFRRRSPALKAAIYAPFALAVPIALGQPDAFQALSLPIAVAFMAILALSLAPVARRAIRGTPDVVRAQSRYMLAYLVIALTFSIEARIILFLYGRMPWWELSMAYMLATGILLFGVLRIHLFDVELKVKFAVRQSTLAAMFIAAFFVVSELAASLLTEQVGTVLGILAAGLLLFAIAPVQRVAERVADRAFPGVGNTQEYLSYRKFEVYKAAVELAAEDGVFTDQERRVLQSLRRTLGIARADAEAMERDILGAGGGTAPA